MVVVPAGEFMMGSSTNERNRNGNEDPLRRVTIAVSKFETTFEQWDACDTVGANVSWGDVQQYFAWLSKMTGRPYRGCYRRGVC
jgi:formylglycine-generating enzyme required for sulfatase activity